MGIGRIDLNLLKVFDAVFEDRNLVLAGRRLHVSQSAVSHAINTLEKSLGVQLFDRVGKKLVINENGRALLPKAAGIVEQAIETEARVWAEVAPSTARASTPTVAA